MNPAILIYLRTRQAALRQETEWLRDRIGRSHDVHAEDQAILDALGSEMVQVTILLEGREPSTRLH